MMLRASSSVNDMEVDLNAIQGKAIDSSAVVAASALANLVDASVNNLENLDAARAELVDATDEATLVYAAAVIANFEMMTRIADGTGTRHTSDRMESMADITTAMGLHDFISARR